jgi:hypothetical protein
LLPQFGGRGGVGVRVRKPRITNVQNAEREEIRGRDVKFCKIFWIIGGSTKQQ